MKKGMTLTSVIIYVIVMLIIVGTVGTITGFFYSSTQNLEESADSLGEFNKFNTYFLEEVKQKGNKIANIEENKISFTSGASFSFVDGAIYRNKVKICSSVNTCQFATYKQEEKNVIQVYLEIGNNFAKTVEYVMDYNTIGSVWQYEENYTLISNNPTYGWNMDAVASTVTEGSRIAPIPAGYVASSLETENKISDGLVIYKGSDVVNSSNHETALKTRNQYVWIPVDDINSMIICKSKTASDTCNVEIQLDGSLKCTTHNSQDLAGKLYTGTNSETKDTNGKSIYTYQIDFAQDNQTYSANSGYREPANLTDATYADASSKGMSEIKTILNNEAATTYDEIKDAWLTLQQNDFNAMAQSVAKYKGFYVSRYEVGTDGGSKKGQSAMTAADNSKMWYGLYSKLRKNESSTTSQMIWRKPV